ncbi:MAG: hypothetical protein L0Z53_26460 [Acidobacteriales bacterium]|nr:hypothetical protein [Terriglobales bacterium]
MLAMMHELAGEDAWISFEGRLSHTELVKIEGGSCDETDVLRRATLSPRLDFILLPLTQATVSAIEKAVSSKVSFDGPDGIVHVQVKKGGTMAFAAYDNFHDDCVVAYSAVPVALLDELVKRKVLHSYATG